MADFLTAVLSKKVNAPKPLLQEVGSTGRQDAIRVDSAKSAIEVLRNQPSRETVSSALKYLTSDGFSLILPEPLNASVAHQLVNDTIPHYWRSLQGPSHQKLFAKVLRNPTGIGHIITRLRSLVVDSRQKKAPGEGRDPSDHLVDMLDLLDGVIRADESSNLILEDTRAYGKNVMQKKLIWREYLSQTASGRIVSIVAEAEDVLKIRQSARTSSWIADGSTFAEWLGRNMAILLSGSKKDEEHISAVVELCAKALTLGYPGKHPI